MHNPHADRTDSAVYERRWTALFVLLLAFFMNMLDTSIMNIGLANLQRSMGASNDQIQWVVEVYVLTYALCFLPFARLGDIVGRKQMILAGMGAFTVSSALCGAAPSSGWLILARATQGLSAAMMSSQVMALAQNLFPPKERRRVFPLFGLAGGMSGIVGPLAGGLLLHANFVDLGWRLLYLINIPVGIATLVGAAMFVPRNSPQAGLKNDWIGIALAVLAVCCLMYPLVEGRGDGWPVWSFVMLAMSAVLSVAFVAWQRRQARIGASALVPIYLWANNDYRIGSAAILVFFSAEPGFFLVFALFLQHGIGFTALQTGIATVWFPIGILIASFLVVRLPNPRTNLFASCVMLIAFFASIALVVKRVPTASLGAVTFGLPMLFGGVATGLGISALFQIVMRTVPLKDAGAGSGTVQVMEQIGTAIGIALMAAIFFSSTSAEHIELGGESAYKAALVNTLVYPLVAYVLVAAAALRIKLLPSQSASGPGAPAPVRSGAGR